MHTSALLSDPVAFVSKCPHCGYEQLQDAYTRGFILRLLEIGHPIEGYCTPCDENWPVDLELRADLAAIALLT